MPDICEKANSWPFGHRRCAPIVVISRYDKGSKTWSVCAQNPMLSCPGNSFFQAKTTKCAGMGCGRAIV
jgi:hypothetical protein